MNIKITCRCEFKTDEVREYTHEKVRKLVRFFDHITKIEVVLNSEKGKYSAEIVISVSRGGPLVGAAIHEDVHAAVDLMIDKMERQLVRYKERLKNRRQSRRNEETEDTGLGGDEEEMDLD